MVLQLLVVVKMCPTPEPTIVIDIQDCVEMFDNDTVSDLSVSGTDLLDCTIQMVDAQPEPEKNELIDKLLNQLQPGGGDEATVMVEAELEKALNMKTQGSKWCCVVVAIWSAQVW